MRPPSLLLAAALAAWVFVVFGTLSTESRFNTYVNPHGKSNALEAASRAGMSSLTFVFDRTGSMFDDLDQVRRGTEGIFNTVMKQRERFIYNYVLVMFHDPDVDDAVVTTEPQIFHQKLRHVNLSGGQDCPEMTLTGIKKALEASLPGSFIFVFTDARSKDFHLIDSVLNLIQEKQTSVVFVMTGDCGDRNHTGYKVFDKIASASFGHVFHLQKSQVTQILAYVRESVSHRRVYLVFEDRLNGQTSTSEVPVDSHLHVLAVSLSLGKNEHDSGKEKEFLEVSIVDPKGNEYTIDSFKNDNSSINLNSVKLFRIEKPMPGMWKVKTSSDNRNSLRIYGHGEMDFRYGFTTIKHENQDILLAQSRPFANQNTYIWVNVTDVNSPGQVERVSIVDYQGKEMFGAPVMMTPHNPNLYVVGPFLPPKGMHFFVRIEGIDDKDYKFVRIASTAVSSYVLKGPKASMLPTTPATLHQSVNLTCNIEAKGPYEVTWKHNNRPLTSMPLYFAKSDTATWPISYVERENAGQYLCIVTSKDGNHTAATVLDMFEPPPEIVSLRNASAVLNGPAVMHCQTQTAEPKFNWYRNGMPVPSGPSTYTYSNGSLVIFNTRRIDAGAYVCQVTTRGGAANATIHLAIFELPTVRVVPKDIFVVENSYFQLNCTSTGVPPPRVGWFHQGVSIDFTRNNAFAVDRYNNLRVYSGTNVKGTFECRANNVAGTASDYSSVNLAERPIINIPKDEYVLGQGDNVVLECQVLRGQPTPRIHWERNGALFASEGDVSNKYIYQKYGNLHIRGASEIDAGDYTCVAENTAGKDSKITRVNIGIAPSVLSLPSKFEATIYKKTQLQCKALGNPLPRVAWYRNGVLLPVNDRFVVGVDGTLTINNVQYNDAGMYVCRATNNYGTQDRSTQLFVVGLEAPVLSTLPPQMQVLEDNDVRIECIIVMGIPTPERIWFKNGKSVDEDLRVFFDGEGSIVIKSVTPADEGVYTCQAKNVVGSASQMTRITMISRPRIPESAQLHAEVGVTPGESLDVPCPVVGNPAPKIVWLLNGHLIDLKHEEYEITFENTLRIKNVNRMHTGTFTCKAVNVAGETSIDTRVSVLTPPVITPGQTSFNHVQGDSIVLPCEVDGEPAPEILWTFNEAPAPGEIDSSGSLIVDNITEEHRGEYRCIARNSVGSDEAAINVTVHTAPIIDGSDVPKTLVIKVNDTAVLPCPARATPPPLRIWMYEGERIELPPEAAHIVEISDDGALVLKATQLEHEGIYECHVSNLAGEDSVIYQLHVQDPPRIISDVPGSFDIVLGLRLDIPCRAIGAPRPVISWQKDGFEIISNSDAEVDPTGTLHIAASTLASEGTYRCVARNPAGEDARSTTVLVREAPIRTASQIDEYTHIEGETAKLKCDVKATPVPIYRWFIGDTEVAADTSRHTMLSEGTLEVTNVGKNDNVVYRCQAENSAGQVDIPIRLAVITSPEITDPDVVEYESIKEHDPFSLYCPVTSHPLPQINWKMDTRPLVADDNVIFSDDMRRLRVLKSKVSDAGIYTCLARNPAGKTTKTFQVEVLVPPQKDETIDGDHITVFEHQPVTMSCPVSGIPIPTIEWYINMVVLKSGETKNGVTVSEDGETITISNALLEHQGTFTCVATSKAGSLPVDIELTVLAPPQVGPNETLSAIIGKAVTLICDVKNEGPKSSITWLFNSKKELPSTAQITPNAKKLIILSVNNEHTGAFECLVRNTAGESRKRFDLDVWAAPTFTDSQVAHEIQLIAGQEKFLKCPIAGNPTPTIEWKRDNLPILEGVSADHQILRIRQNEHGRYRYTCVATNKAGTVFRDFVVETITPPRLAGGGEAGGVQLIEIIQGHSATLDCPIATSQSAIKMDWIRDGREIERGTPRISIMADGTRLLMGNVQQEDESVFTCVAKNPAGEDSRNFKLVVLVPPRLEGAMVENVDIIEGDELDLECMFSAYPDPAVAWTKNLANLPEKFTLLNEDRSAYLETTTPTDAGAYQCRLTNAAGTAEKTFNVRVISAPKLIDSGSIKVIEASQGMPVTLKCPIAITSEANSNIEVTWTHNKLPLSPDYIFNNGFSILAGGYQLYLPKAHVADAGTYACVAKNEAGESVKNFNLLVLVKPHILSDHGDFKVVENNTIVLPCEVDGSPTPDIVWTKDDKLAANLTDVAILSGGQQFKILAANLEHQGKYKCTASNKIGSSDISFDVDVITRPTIAQSVQNIIETVKNDKAVFDCTVENRDFDGEITWFKNYDPIIPGDKYTLMKSGRKLVVNSVDLSDEASYSCKVRNDAGTATVNYSLSVLVPPTIIILEKDKNRTVVENSSLTLSCPATGKPEPKIRWFKDGELVLAENITTKINSGKMKGNDLRIEGIMLINDGTFTCEAKNDAGVVEQDVNVYVMTPPVILRDNISSDIQGKRSSHTEIQCFSTGRPTPTVTWLKNGRPLEKTPNVYLSSNHMRLHLTHLTDRHVDKYTCIARNPAGEDKRDFTLTLLEVPKINTSNLPKTIETNARRTTSLSCPAVGHPEPAIHWLRDGMALPTDDERFVFLNGGKTLQIKDLRTTDKARYMCMAENDVGFADYSVDLRVIGPPEIKGHAIETIIGLINSPKELRCEVTGTQPITIEWLKAGRALGSEASAFIQATNQGQRLHHLSAQRGDSALYTCVAKNAAGEARKNFDFQVQIPPSINDSISSPLIQSALPEGDFKVECIVDAIPEANIKWFHNGNPVTADGVVLTLSNKNQTLFVHKVDESHGGAYTCKAENPVGQTSRKYLVNLAAVPTFAISKETVNVYIGHHVTLNCKTNGGTGRISTIWLLNGRPAKQGNNSQTVHVEGKKIRINKIRFSDAGDYVCIARNEAGEARKTYNIHVLEKPRFVDKSNTSIAIIIGRPFTLDCVVHGTPRPTVKWLKDGVVIDDETCEERGDCQFMAENQRLIIEEARERDAGRYSCVAENVPGRDEKDIVVSLLMPPIMKIHRIGVEIAQGNARTLVCPIDDTSVSISWMKDEVLIRPTSTLQILNSGRSLYIAAAEPNDSAKYSCKAVNEAGDATTYFDVTVLVQPKILGPEFRNVDAISNDTVPLACKTTGIPAPTIEWYHEDEKIKQSLTHEVTDNGTLLKIHNIKGNQAGRYTCVAKNKVGKSEANVFVEVSEIPQIIDSPSEVKVIAGSERSIKCHVKGVPKPDVTWKKNGENVETSGTGERYIHIAKAQSYDAGRYTCIAANRAGERRHNIQVHVLVPPTIAENERYLKAIEGNAVALTCATSGVPKPEIRWFKNGVILPNATQEELLLPNLTSADATKYSCESRNEAGSTNADFVVDVFVKPRIRNHTAEVRVIEGEKARLDCKAGGNPPPTVTWLRGGRKITDMTNFLLSPLGESLMILKTKTNDAGSYSCVAKNFAGESEVSFSVIVLTAPYLPVQVDQNPKVIYNKDVTLQCPVRGNPEPEVKWILNGNAIDTKSGSYERSNNDLVIKSANSDMAGRYTCHAENEVNHLDTEYALEVIAPPKIGSTGRNDYEVLSGDSITMVCPIETTSLPSIVWLRGGNDVEPTKNVQISADGLKLTIVEAALEDNGKYVCSATNVAGTANIDVFLKVYVAPTIDDSNLIENPLAVFGKVIFLECPADGIPQPTVTWMRDDQPIEVREDKFIIRQNNITFAILNVQLNDAGKYSCIAENKGGRAEEHFFLQVLAPPLLTNKEVLKIVKREGDEVKLVCPVQPSASDSIEERDITWVKDGRTIGGTAFQYGTENAKTRIEKTFTISKHGYRLTIPSLRLEDAGDYRCIVANRAGEVSGRFIVETLSKPTIDPSRATPEAHVIQGRPYTINCPVSGHPFPVITWFKERLPADPTTNPTVRVIDKGQKLEILTAAPIHKGLWTCAAENDAGDTELNVRLDVWTPPVVTVKSGKEGAIRPLGKSITLFCEVTGNPAPIVQWQFDGRVLIHSPEGTQLSDGNARLDIPVLKLEDAGGYTCSAKNEVGTDEATIEVNILVPSKIDRDGVALNQRLPTGQTLTLFCDVKGKPLPKISWYANDTVIDASVSERIKVGTGGEYIEITSVTLADHGIYRCLAENPAGNDTLDYKVEIDQKPSIVNSGTFQTHESKVATLTCNVTGEPAPKITWLRNGMRLETNVHYIIEKNTLKVMDTRSDSDSGIYLCMAQNEAGSVQQAFTLEVYVAPKIQSTSDNETIVAIGEPFSLTCGAFGHPLPEIIWKINDENLETLQSEHRIEEDFLHVKGLQTKGTYVFRCTVHNAAGVDEIEYTVKVIAPPTLIQKGIQSLNVTEGEPTIIFCGVDADIGEAEITWTKNDAPIAVTNGDKPSDIVITNHGKQLKIAETVLAAEGIYVCTAVNSAGNATQTTKLYVGAPPKISEDQHRITVKRGETIKILCEAVGMPPPTITWLKDNKTLAHVPVEESKTTAIFDNVQPDQAGVYTCTATNWAGTVSKDVDLLILIPPAISDEKLNFTANPQDNVILPCNATGIPEPVVSWTKNPNVDISSNSDKFQVLGSSLAIKNVSSSDDGFYHCIAKSEAGQVVATRKISVSVPLIKNRVLWAVCDEKDEPIDSLFKQVRGDTPDLDNDLDHWDNKNINESNDAVVKCLPNGRNARTLEKSADGNPEAPPQFTDEPPTMVELAKNDEIKIVCVAVGPPVPEIYFVQNNTLLSKTKSPDGKTELILMGNRDKNNNVYGNYACLAKNSVGEARKDFMVVQKADIIMLPSRPPSEIELTVLDCINDDGIVTQEHVAWKLDDALVGHLDDSQHAMNNGSLVLKYFAEEGDLNEFSCFIDGKPGNDFRISHVIATEEVPMVKIKPQRIYAQPGSNVSIDCHLSSGNPLMTRIRWSIDNIDLAPDGDKFQVLPNNTLVIQHSLQTDRGNYKCRGWNDRGKSWDGVKLVVEDAPSTVNSKISGFLNHKKFGELILKANFTPNVESNDISVTINNLAGDHATVSRSIISVASMPLVMLGYAKSGESRSIRKRPAKFERRTKYDFDSGESLFVKQKAKGMSEDSFNLDIEVEGDVPKGDRYDHAEFEPWQEDLIEDFPGHLIGNGRSAVLFGTQHRVPFKWSDSIHIEDDSETDGEFIGKGETFQVISEPTFEPYSNNVYVSTKVGRLGRCPDGYYKNKERCRDVDECRNDPELCGPVDLNSTICVNLGGTYKCQALCPDGFKSNIDGECLDIDECILDIAECALGQECQNTEGGYDCIDQCAVGYETLEDGECVDINECFTSPCAAPMTCKNLMGTYACVCPPGFPAINNGTECKGLVVNPVRPLKVLDFAMNKHNCPPGYYWNKGVCEDIGECEFDAPCAYKCTNLPGSYECECPDGYIVKPDGSCEDIDECQFDDVCLETELCFNELGRFSCLRHPCPKRYVLNRDNMECLPDCRSNTNCTEAHPVKLHMLRLRNGIEARTPLIRLTASDLTGRVLRRSSFGIRSPTQFYLKNEANGLATVFNKNRLEGGSRHQIYIRSSGMAVNKTKYKTDFLVFLSVSEHPF